MTPAMVRLGLFTMLLLAALVALLPLRLVIAGSELAAHDARGSIWAGRLTDARWRGIGLGDLAIGIEPLALMGGRAVFAITGPALRGRVSRTGVEGLAGQVGVAGATPLPLAGIAFDAVSVDFSGGTCRTARGTVRITAAGGLAGAGGSAAVFAGTPRCESGRLLLPLAAPGGGRIDVGIAAGGRYRAQVTLAGVDEAARPGLLAAGFQPTPQGVALTLEGSL